ncbi:ABC transporter substrate-binding protein [Peristeroidobacter soli]|uniref:ABC transporter substrate-binding protein n=1 Tax=Peristeroidobacter soli TaxID=2497877 RepID=UPI00101CD9CC|nr:extracellular solute-binding protein [Peristeroidobacter soli]
MQYLGLTWDHPRGYNALAAAAARLDASRDRFTLAWQKQPLEGFEAHPIADLCARYDLVVLDHPHVGEAVASECLQPLESLFTAEEIAALEADTIGPCLSSYKYEGQHWALPLDAATQVMAYRADLIGGEVPVTWDEVIALSARVPVALSIAGPHAALSFQSIATAFGESPAHRDPAVFVSETTGLAVLDVMARLASRSPSIVWALNPIGILAHMAQSQDVGLCPLIYGYVNYASTTVPDASSISFTNAPRWAAGGRPGSTLGGTGIGISTRCKPSPELLNHLRWLLSEVAQSEFIPSHDGQPSRRSSWHNAAVNERWNNFYEHTAETLEKAYVRPRFNGAIAFQTRCSQLLRDGLVERRSHRAVLSDIQDAYGASFRAAAA